MEKIKKKEIKRIRHILDEIVSLAEDDELQGGLPNVVNRYNAIVRHFEGSEVLPAGLFQLLSEEGTVTFHQVAVECRMLSGYLEEIVDEEEEEQSRGRPDFGPVIALAPFLDQSDLKTLIQSHLSGKGFTKAADEEEDAPKQGPPDLKTIVGLAPHMNSKDLAVLLDACLSREPLSNPKLLVALAPHLDSEDLGRILRQHAPNWFGAKAREEPSHPPDTRSTDLTPTTWQAPRPESEPR
jgi:hypothetical protein